MTKMQAPKRPQQRRPSLPDRVLDALDTTAISIGFIAAAAGVILLVSMLSGCSLVEGDWSPPPVVKIIRTQPAPCPMVARRVGGDVVIGCMIARDQPA